MKGPPVDKGVHPELRIQLLGEFVVWVGGERIPTEQWKSRRARNLVKLLALAPGHRLHRDQISEILWPGSDPSAATNNFHQSLYAARRVLEPAGARTLLMEEGFLNLSTGREQTLWVDVERFEAAATEALAVAKDGRDPAMFQAALALYKGTLLPDDLYDEWTFQRREALKQRYQNLLLELALLLDARHDQPRAIETLMHLLSEDRDNEEAHAQLMRLYALSGQRSLALAQFEVCRRNLDMDLNVRPGKETIQIYEQVRDNFLFKTKEVQTPQHNLPAELSPLVGRIMELAKIEQMLAEPSCRLLTLVAPGGSGKTRLALEVAHRQVELFSEGVYFISLAHIHSLEAVTTTVAHVLGLTFPQVDNPHSMLLDYLRQKKILLIMDHFEHVLEAVNLVVDILHTAGGVKILATSRERLNLQDEHIILLGALTFPTEKITDMDHALVFEAVRLFLESAQRVQPTFLLTDQDVEAIGSICQQVQGMPLAVLLAASWCSTLPVQEIAIELQKNSLDFLRTEWRDLPERQRSMQAVFEYSYGLLKNDEQNIFEGLGIFQGGVSYQAAISVIQTDLFHLRRLVDKTMLQRLSAGRFELHDLLRQFALKKLAGRIEFERSLREKHMLFFTDALKDLAADLQGPRQAEAVRALLPDLPNAQAAWTWAVEQRRVDCLEQALDGLCGMYQWYNRYSEGGQACRIAAERLSTGMLREPDEAEICLLIRVLAWHVYFDEILGQVTGPKQNLELAFQLMANLDPEREASRTTRAFLLQQAGLYYIEKDFSRGWDYWLESLALYRELENRWGEAQMLEHLGWSVPHQDSFETSRTWLEESLTIRRALGDQNGVASALHYLILEAAQEGDFERMGLLIQESLECSQMLGNRAVQADVQYAMGIRLAYQGKFSESLAALKEAAEQFGELGMKDKLSMTLEIQGWIEVNLGYYNQGRADVEASIEIVTVTNNQNIRAAGLWGLGQILAVEGSTEQAVRTLRESVSLYRQMPQRDEMGMVLCDLAVFEEQLGLREQAILDMREGVAIAAQAGSWQAKVIVLANYAPIIASQGELERAIELYALATRYPYLGNSRYWWDVIGNRLYELATRISVEVREAAEQRGRIRDLDEAFDEIKTVLLKNE